MLSTTVGSLCPWMNGKSARLTLREIRGSSPRWAQRTALTL